MLIPNVWTEILNFEFQIKRSTNGIMWVEYLSELMSDAALYDFAQSGATASNVMSIYK